MYARDIQINFHHLWLGKMAFGATAPHFSEKLFEISAGRDPFRMPLALTLQRKNQKAQWSGTLGQGKFKNGNTENGKGISVNEE